jgi:hypothetical protein
MTLVGIKIHLDYWPSLCRKNEFGGVGVPDLNVCLLGSGVKQFIKVEGCLWKKVIEAKYNTRS